MSRSSASSACSSEDATVGTPRQVEGDQSDDDDRPPAHPKKLPIAGGGINEPPVEILRDGRRSHQQLGVRRAHNRTENAGQHHPGEQGREEGIREQQENPFAAGSGQVPRKVNVAEDAHEEAGDQTHRYPAHGEAPGAGETIR